MKTKIIKTQDDWKLIKNACRTTVHKKFSEKEPSEKFKKDLLIAEHSPIRLWEVYWKWEDIPYWVSTEWSRHKHEKFISSQRNDRQSSYDRNKAPQDSKVDMDNYANMQNLIDMFRKRLCHQSTDEARGLAEDFKRELSLSHKEESDVLVPNCIYRGGCPELSCCGLWQKFLKWSGDRSKDLGTIQKRYDAFNEYFYDSLEDKKESRVITEMDEVISPPGGVLDSMLGPSNRLEDLKKE